MKINAAHLAAPTRSVAMLASRLERAGCDGMYLAEVSHDALLGSAVAATATSSIAVGTSIALAFTRSPTALAYAAHDLNTASEGRFILGLGPQVRPHIERRFGLKWSDPVKRMRETVLAIRAVGHCWQTGEMLRFEGELLQLSLMPPAFRPDPTPWGVPAIYLAAVGPQMAELAGEIADGLFVHGFSTPAYVSNVLLPAIERGLARSGRTRADFQLCYSAFIGDAATAASPAAARKFARSGVAFYASTPDYARVLKHHGLGDLQPMLQQMTREGNWAEMSQQISDEVLDLFCVTGTAGEIADELLQRWGSLVDQISLPSDFWVRHEGAREWEEAAARLREA